MFWNFSTQNNWSSKPLTKGSYKLLCSYKTGYLCAVVYPVAADCTALNRAKKNAGKIQKANDN